MRLFAGKPVVRRPLTTMTPPERPAGQTTDARILLRRFWRSASGFWQGRSALLAWSLSVFLLFLVLAQLFVQYRLNLWNRNFFDALDGRSASALWMQAQIFVALAAASLTLAATSVWGRMTMQRKWREFVTRRVATDWLAQDRFRRLNGMNSGSENPEYRISEDVRVATDSPIDLALALVTSFLTAAVFIGVLWNVGGSITIQPFGTPLVIPGYLVIGVVVYSTFFSGMMLVVGRNLTGVIERKNQAEAEFRAAADALREGGGANGSSGWQTAARRTLWTAIHVVLDRWRALCWELVRTTLVSQGNFLLAPVVAWLLCAPKYLSGAISLGELTQAAAAFISVQGAFNWLVDNYQRLSDWRSSVNRVAALLLALDSVDEAGEDAGTPSSNIGLS